MERDSELGSGNYEGVLVCDAESGDESLRAEAKGEVCPSIRTIILWGGVIFD